MSHHLGEAVDDRRRVSAHGRSKNKQTKGCDWEIRDIINLFTRLKLHPRAMPRAIWKGPFFVRFPGLAQAVSKNTPIATQGTLFSKATVDFFAIQFQRCWRFRFHSTARSCTILPSFVGLKFLVHNGKNYIPLLVTEDMIGHKLGEFAPTRKSFSYRFTKAK